MLSKEWKKSSYSGHEGACVEARLHADGGVEVRDSKDLQGPTLTARLGEWSGLVAIASASR